MDINLNLYKYFYEVAKYKSFTKASERLLVSQPAISYSVKTLESQLGIKLFNRNKSSISLTDEGKVIFDKLTKIFKEFDEIYETTIDKNYKGKLVVAARIAYVTGILTDTVVEFNKIYPDIKIEILARHRYEMEDLLESGKTDLILDENLYGKDLKNSQNTIVNSNLKSTFIVSNKYKDLFNDVLIDEEYLRKSEVYVVKSNNYTQELIKAVPNINCNYVLSTQMILKKINDMPAIGHIPEFIVKKEIEDSDVIVLNSCINIPNINVYGSYLVENDNPKLQAFLSFMANNCTE